MDKGTDPSLFNKHQAALSIYCDSCSNTKEPFRMEKRLYIIVIFI